MNSAEAGSHVAATASAPERESAADRAYLYVLSVCAASALFLLALVYLQTTWSILPSLSFVGLAFFSAVGVFADRYKIDVLGRTEVSATFLADFLAATILGPLGGMVVAGLSVLARGVDENRVKTGFFLAAYATPAGVAGLVYWAAADQAIGGDWLILIGGLGAAFAYQLSNYLLFVPIALIRYGMGPRLYFDEAFKPFLPFHIFFLLISLALLYSFQQYGSLLFGLLILPVLGLVYAFRVFARERELVRSLERFSLQIASSMLTALDMKDNYTAQHSAAVATYAYDIAHSLRLPKRDCNLAHLAGLLHDLGKISVPDEVLNSRRRLDDDEWQIIQGHTTAGQKILSDMSEFEELGQIVLHHHERFDGSGYPIGLSGEDIPLISRIVSVADCYSAMVSDRPYAPRRSPAAAEAELRKQRGSQFDPRVADAFLELLAAADSDYRLGREVDFHLQFQKVRFLRDIA